MQVNDFVRTQVWNLNSRCAFRQSTISRNWRALQTLRSYSIFSRSEQQVQTATAPKVFVFRGEHFSMIFILNYENKSVHENLWQLGYFDKKFGPIIHFLGPYLSYYQIRSLEVTCSKPLTNPPQIYSGILMSGTSVNTYHLKSLTLANYISLIKSVKLLVGSLGNFDFLSNLVSRSSFILNFHIFPLSRRVGKLTACFF